MYTVKSKHKDKSVKYRLFVVPDDGPALLGMLDINLLSILGTMCDITGEPHESRKFDLQTIVASNISSWRTSKAPQTETDKVGMCDVTINILNYFRSITNKPADKRASKVLKTKCIKNSVFSQA